MNIKKTLHFIRLFSIGLRSTVYFNMGQDFFLDNGLAY